MAMLLLYAILQSAVAPPRPPVEGERPLNRMPSREELAADRTFRHDLPGPLVEFLGRRRICAERSADEGEEAEDRRRFLRCETLSSEETEWRRRFAGDAAVEAALNEEPRSYRIPRILGTFDGVTANINARRFALDGVEPESGTAVSVVIESSSSPTSVIRVTASWGNVPARTIELPAPDLPNFDMSNISLWLRPAGEHPGLSITARFGRHRGYCWEGEADDRPKVNIFFTPFDVAASSQGWPECNPSHDRVWIGPAAALRR